MILAASSFFNFLAAAALSFCACRSSGLAVSGSGSAFLARFPSVGASSTGAGASADVSFAIFGFCCPVAVSFSVTASSGALSAAVSTAAASSGSAGGSGADSTVTFFRRRITVGFTRVSSTVSSFLPKMSVLILATASSSRELI